MPGGSAGEGGPGTAVLRGLERPGQLLVPRAPWRGSLGWPGARVGPRRGWALWALHPLERPLRQAGPAEGLVPAAAAALGQGPRVQSVAPGQARWHTCGTQGDGAASSSWPWGGLASFTLLSSTASRGQLSPILWVKRLRLGQVWWDLNAESSRKAVLPAPLHPAGPAWAPPSALPGLGAGGPLPQLCLVPGQGWTAPACSQVAAGLRAVLDKAPGPWQGASS